MKILLALFLLLSFSAAEAAVSKLHKAVQDNDINQARVLLQAGADPNAETTYDETPLHWATHYSTMAMIKLLLNAGTDPCNVNRDGKTPRQMANERSRTPEARLLLEVMRSKPNPALLVTATEENDLETVRILLEIGTDPNKPGWKGSTKIRGVKPADIDG